MKILLTATSYDCPISEYKNFLDFTIALKKGGFETEEYKCNKFRDRYIYIYLNSLDDITKLMKLTNSEIIFTEEEEAVETVIEIYNDYRE